MYPISPIRPLKKDPAAAMRQIEQRFVDIDERRRRRRERLALLARRSSRRPAAHPVRRDTTIPVRLEGRRA